MRVAASKKEQREPDYSRLSHRIARWGLTVAAAALALDALSFLLGGDGILKRALAPPPALATQSLPPTRVPSTSMPLTGTPPDRGWSSRFPTDRMKHRIIIGPGDRTGQRFPVQSYMWNSHEVHWAAKLFCTYGHGLSPDFGKSESRSKYTAANVAKAHAGRTIPGEEYAAAWFNYQEHPDRPQCDVRHVEGRRAAVKKVWSKETSAHNWLMALAYPRKEFFLMHVQTPEAEKVLTAITPLESQVEPNAVVPVNLLVELEGVIQKDWSLLVDQVKPELSSSANLEPRVYYFPADDDSSENVR